MSWGRTLKKALQSFDFPTELAKWRKMAADQINGVLFAVLKCRVLQKRHRPPHDKTSGLSYDTALYPHEYKNLHEDSYISKKMNKKREKKYIQPDQPA
jgi:hypothetical protein